MEFLNQWFLLGLAGVSVPIIIHLLNRYRPRTIQWAAMEFLRRAMAVRSRQIRVEDLLLLLLRCLAVALLALAMSRPVIKASGPKWLSGESYAGVVIALDASYSMGHKSGVQSRFDKGVERTREILKTLQPGNPVTLVLMGAQPRTLFRNVGYDPERFEAALKDAACLPERLNLEPCLEEAANLLAEIKAPIRECYVISDGQAISWGNPSDIAKAAMTRITNDGKNKLYFVQAGDDDNENLGVTNFELASGALYKGSLARYVANVRNFGAHAREKVAVNLVQDGVATESKTIDRIDPGQTVPVELYARFDKDGPSRLTVALGPDELLADNTRHATVVVKDRIRVLVVGGESAADRNETLFLLPALSPRTLLAAKALTGAPEPVQVIPVTSRDLPMQRLNEFDVVILADVATISPETATGLFNFVQEGGGLVVFPGKNVAASSFNAAFKANGQSFLPAELQDVIGSETDRTKGWPVESAGADNPISLMVKLQPAERLNEGKVYRAFKLRPLTGGRPLLNLGGAGDAYLVEKRLGKGKVLLCSTSAGMSWNDLPKGTLYPMLLQQAVTYLTRPSYEQSFTVGSPLAVQLPREGFDPTVTFHDAKDKLDTVAATQQEGQMMAVLPAARTPGFYEIQYSKDAAPLVAAVNLDTLESDVTMTAPKDIQGALTGVPIGMLDDKADVFVKIKEGRLGKELWQYLMAAALFLLVLESFLARRFSQRVHDSAADAVAGTQRASLATGTTDAA
jgi:hypothetical protein